MLLIGVLLLGAPLHAAEPTLTGAQAAYARGDFAAASLDYESIARSASDAFAGDYWLLAADCAVRAGNGARAEQLFGRIDTTNLDDHQRARLQLLHAQSDLLRNKADAALSALPATPADESLADATLQIRAQALFRTGDLAGAVSALVKREGLLESPEAIQANRTTIWNFVTGATPSGQALAGATDATTRGWLELGQLAHRAASLAELDAWRRRYPKHPGEDRLAQLMMPDKPAVASPAAPIERPAITLPPVTPANNVATAQSRPPAPPASTAMDAAEGAATGSSTGTTVAGAAPISPSPTGATTVGADAPSASAAASATEVPAALPMGAVDGGFVALLLPQSGPLAAAGTMVQEGFGNAEPARVYDTGSSPATAVEAYHRAIAEGASLVVGPLGKDATIAIANSGVSLPMLSLNYLDANSIPPPGLWQFGLAPEDEAIAAADDAVARGLKRAVVMTPAGEWGERLTTAFRARMATLGGTVIQADAYPVGTNDFGPLLRRLLKLDAAESRHHQVSATLGVQTEFTAQPRSDIDFVFIGARAAQARLIVPQLHFYRAEELPIYATSAAFDGGTGPDLVGLRVCDVPALTQSGIDASTPVDRVRLTALGHDAAQLAQALHNGGLTADRLIDGQTGRLTVGPNNSIHRQLSCAEISDGGLRALR